MSGLRSVWLVVLLALGCAVPAAAQDGEIADTVQVNVIICADPDCVDTVNIETMLGATVTSYAPDGSLVDSCTVTLSESEMVTCNLIPAPDRGSYDVWPAEEYVGYVMLSAHPEIFQSEMHGPIYVWYFAPEKDNIAPPPTQAPLPDGSVVELPSTGTGSGVESGLMAGVAMGIAVISVVVSGVRVSVRG